MNYFDNLWYVGGHDRKYGSMEFLPIPDWVRFYAELGRSLSIGNLDGIKRIAAISLPTRSYCSPFVAAGAIAQQASEHTAGSASIFQHFEEIKALPNGSPVSIKQSGTNKIKRGTKIGFEEEWKGFGPLVKIQVSRGGSKSVAETILVTPQRCSDVDPNPFGTTKLPINPDWDAVPEGELFLSSFLGDVNLTEFYSTSSLDCLILGQVNLLDSEITETNIAVARPDLGQERLTHPKHRGQFS